ncbi:cupin domain-containing protein [Solicola gregarius]|uniref:cupin domain-containing protein n=1 Tax=Solicola gregarius TaxID=2908642 RepID=UPI0038CD165A
MTAPAAHFAGSVSAEELAVPTGDSLLAVYAVTFEAGAHTHWHIHPKAQGLFVIRGVALVHVEGHRPVRLGAGGSVWISAIGTAQALMGR